MSTTSRSPFGSRRSRWRKPVRSDAHTNEPSGRNRRSSWRLIQHVGRLAEEQLARSRGGVEADDVETGTGPGSRSGPPPRRRGSSRPGRRSGRRRCRCIRGRARRAHRPSSRRPRPPRLGRWRWRRRRTDRRGPPGRRRRPRRCPGARSGRSGSPVRRPRRTRSNRHRRRTRSRSRRISSWAMNSASPCDRPASAAAGGHRDRLTPVGGDHVHLVVGHVPDAGPVVGQAGIEEGAGGLGGGDHAAGLAVDAVEDPQPVPHRDQETIGPDRPRVPGDPDGQFARPLAAQSLLEREVILGHVLARGRDGAHRTGVHVHRDEPLVQGARLGQQEGDRRAVRRERDGRRCDGAGQRSASDIGGGERTHGGTLTASVDPGTRVGRPRSPRRRSHEFQTAVFDSSGNPLVDSQRAETGVSGTVGPSTAAIPDSMSRVCGGVR